MPSQQWMVNIEVIRYQDHRYNYRLYKLFIFNFIIFVKDYIPIDLLSLSTLSLENNQDFELFIGTDSSTHSLSQV